MTYAPLPHNPRPFAEGDRVTILYSKPLGVFEVQGCWETEDGWFCVASNARANWSGPAGHLVPSKAANGESK